MKNNYYIKQDRINTDKISASLMELPPFCTNFIYEIENNTSSLTRLGYTLDLRIFFDFISKYKFGIPIKEINFSHLEKITASDIISFLSYLSYYTYNEKNYKNNEKGKARKLASIRGLFKYLYNNDKIKFDVASKVTTPKIHEKSIVRLEVDEIIKILDQAETANDLTDRQRAYLKNTRERDVAILSLFLGTGIRVSELVGINIDNIDFESNSFKVTRKGGNQTILYFSDEVKIALLDWLEIRTLKNLPKTETALFISLQNKRISVRAVENLVKKYAKPASPLKNISPHKLRSTYGTNLYRATKDIYIVADVLGHKDVNTTKKHYAAISEDIRKNAANQVNLRVKNDK
ncbi:MAG: tyrosine-type recombinase/integrase [Clostridia bacterium]|nr:tyrosine-type recombinase/integrase [Clostridia bacterium]MDD4685688.1 tyrosine-type recombinase/integrase [Clostridia bacterium]